jgi:nucleotide-binding universal stress UspA family protein
LAGRDLDHAKCVTTAHRLDRQPAVMFSNVVVGVKELEAGRDALCLARPLTSANGNLTLAHVQVVAPKPAPDSGAAGAAARHQDALERLTALRDESRLDAEVVCGEARDVQTGLHDITRAGDADLLVIGASREDEIYRDLVSDDARQLLDNPPCAVAVAPAGYSARPASLQTIGVAYDRSPGSDRVLAVAKTLAAGRHATLSAFHAVSGLHVRDPGRFEESIDDEVTQARDLIGNLGVEAHAEYGDPVAQLESFGRSVDLLVLGSHRRGPVGPLGTGIAQRLADAPPCPLLVVRRRAYDDKLIFDTFISLL